MWLYREERGYIKGVTVMSETLSSTVLPCSFSGWIWFRATALLLRSK